MTVPSPVAADPQLADAEAADPFAIDASTSLQERRPRTLKHGESFALFDGSGNIPSGRDAPEGLYHRDTRYLSHFDLLVAGVRPLLLSSTMRDDNATLTCDLTNPDLVGTGGEAIEHDLIHIRRTKFVYEATCYERVAVRNYAASTQRIAIELRFAADFADLFEVRGQIRAKRGELHAPVLAESDVVLSYTGLDAVRRSTSLRFDPMPSTLQPNRAVFVLTLPPGGRAVLHVEAACDAVHSTRTAAESFFVALRDARRALRSAASRATAIASDNEVFNEAVRRSVADLYMLVTDTPQGPYPFAGTPWYSTAFGRDALITAMMTLWMDPAIARGVLGFLAANQATETDPLADAEPGKILHEVRRGEMAELREVPFRRYYGSVDATPLFVVLAGAYLDRTGDLGTLRPLWPNIAAALHWMDEYGDRDRDGFVEYARGSGEGLANQGWKDSHDAVFHADGRMAIGPIALCEVQGYVYAAKRAAARIASALGEKERAVGLETAARALRVRIEHAFWCEDLGTYALALDRDKQPCRVRASNAGHLLLAGVPSEARARSVADGLLASNFLSGWGVRTIATGEARYNPMSYHNGSVWPHDNAMIAIGLSRYGLREEAARLLEGVFDACAYIDLRRLPELLCGFPRRKGQGPTFYPVACAPQAWAAATLLSMLQSCLGLSFDPRARAIHFETPVLPRFVDRIVLRSLRLGGASMDLALERSGRSVALSVLDRSGAIRATVTN